MLILLIRSIVTGLVLISTLAVVQGQFDWGVYRVTTSIGMHGSYWARIDKAGWRMDRGPYPFHWMAQAAFPVARWHWATPW